MLYTTVDTVFDVVLYTTQYMVVLAQGAKNGATEQTLYDLISLAVIHSITVLWCTWRT